MAAVGPKRRKRWTPSVYTKSLHSASRSATKREIKGFIDNIRTNSPEFLEGLGHPSWSDEALLAPIIGRAIGSELINLESDLESYGGLVELSQLAPHHLLMMISDALKDRAEKEPNWQYGPGKRKKGGEEKSWGPGTKVNPPSGDLPPTDDPRFGTW